MNFKQALKLMYEGKKVRSNKWLPKDIYIKIEDDEIVSSWGDSCVVTLASLQDDEWEIYEEPKQSPCNCHCSTCVCPSDSKYFGIGEAIRRMKLGKLISIKIWNNPNIYIYYADDGGSIIPEIKVKTIRGLFATWMPNHTELMSEEYYEVDGD